MPPMMLLLLLFSAFLIILMVFVLPKLPTKLPTNFSQPPPPRYTKQPSLLTPAERSFYGVLTQTVGSEYVVFAKVRLADLIKPEPTIDRSEWQTAFNRISAKHIDFVLCRPSDLSIALAVELDDGSHSRLSRLERDVFVDSALAAANLPVLRVSAGSFYSPEKLKGAISSLTKPTAPTRPS